MNLLYIASVCPHSSNQILLLRSFAKIILQLVRQRIWNLVDCCSINIVANMTGGCVAAFFCRVCIFRVFRSTEVTDKISSSLSKVSALSPTSCSVDLFLLELIWHRDTKWLFPAAHKMDISFCLFMRLSHYWCILHWSIVISGKTSSLLDHQGCGISIFGGFQEKKLDKHWSGMIEE